MLKPMKTIALVNYSVAGGFLTQLWRAHGNGNEGNNVENVSQSSVV